MSGWLEVSDDYLLFLKCNSNLSLQVDGMAKPPKSLLAKSKKTSPVKVYATAASSKHKSPKKSPKGFLTMKKESKKYKKQKDTKQSFKKSKSPKKAKGSNNQNSLSFVSRSSGNHLSKPSFFDEQEQAVLLIQQENESSNGSDISYIIEVVEEDSTYDSIVPLNYAEEEVSTVVDHQTPEHASLDSASTVSSIVSPPVVCTPVFSLSDTTPVRLRNMPNSHMRSEVSPPFGEKQTEDSRNQSDALHAAIQSIQNTASSPETVELDRLAKAIETLKEMKQKTDNTAKQSKKSISSACKSDDRQKKQPDINTAPQSLKSFTPAAKLTKSKSLDKNKKIFKTCDVCGYQTHADHIFQIHLKTHQQFSCDFCDCKFVQEVKLKRHIRVHHPVSETEKTVLCAFCGQCFPSQNLLQKHEKKHTDEVKTEAVQVSDPDCVKLELPKENKCSTRKSMTKIFQKFKKDGTFICKTCSYRTIHLNNFRRHLRTHGAEKFQCPKCNKSYTEKEKLNKHIKIVHDNNPYLCEICGKGLNSREGMMYHVQGHLTNRKPRISEYLNTFRTSTGFTCNVCGYKTQFSNNLRRHLSIHGKKLDCPQCHLLFTNEKTLEQHIEKNHNSPCLCTTCGLVMKSEKHLQKHMKKHQEKEKLRKLIKNQAGELVIIPDIHDVSMVDVLTPKKELEKNDKTNSANEAKYSCATCGFQTQKARQLVRHENMHARGMLSCAKCGKEFLEAKNLSQHFKLKHGPSYQCPKCPQVLKTQEMLQRHIWKHKTARDGKSFLFNCTDCSYKTNQSNNYRRHQKVHTGERYKCSICGSMYSDIFKLKNHIRLAHVQPLRCKVCGKTYTSKKGYQEHMNIKHGNPKKYNCQYCQKVFNYYYNYKSHLNTHEKSVFYRCGKCGKDSLWRSSLMIHMKKCTGTNKAKDEVKAEKE